MKSGTLVKLAIIAACAAAVVAIAPFLGSSSLSFERVFDSSIPRANNSDAAIFFGLRLPRVMFGAVAGAALALAGALMQSVLRNDLATPYTMGISSGAAVGALIVLHALPHAPSALIAVAALVGAILTMALVLSLARKLATREATATLLLAGVTLNVLLGSVILVIQYLADPFQAFTMIRWLMGAVDVTRIAIPAWLSAFVAGGLIIAISMGRRLNALEVGDLAARGFGIEPRKTRLQALALASVATAVIVAYAGPIGFVGLIIPHAAKRFVGTDHRVLLPACAFAGAAFLVMSDAIGRVAGSGLEIPVGIITSLIGGPVFLAILFSRRH